MSVGIGRKMGFTRIRLAAIMGSAVSVAIIILALLALQNQDSKTVNEAKLDRGEITLTEYCAMLGRDALNESKCKGFIKKYGPNPF